MGLARWLGVLSVGLAGASARAEDHGAPRRLESYVRLARPAIGCATLDGAAKVAEAAILRDQPSLDEAMEAGGCRLFKTMRGAVTHATEDAICVLDIGRTRCLWFVPDAMVPAVEH